MCDIRCDVSLKARLFYILITNVMSNSDKYCSKKKNNGKLRGKDKFTGFIVNGGTVTKAILDISRDVWRKNVKPV